MTNNAIAFFLPAILFGLLVWRPYRIISWLFGCLFLGISGVNFFLMCWDANSVRVSSSWCDDGVDGISWDPAKPEIECDYKMYIVVVVLEAFASLFWSGTGILVIYLATKRHYEGVKPEELAKLVEQPGNEFSKPSFGNLTPPPPQPSHEFSSPTKISAFAGTSGFGAPNEFSKPDGNHGNHGKYGNHGNNEFSQATTTSSFGKNEFSKPDSSYGRNEFSKPAGRNEFAQGEVWSSDDDF
eukprot:CAMPEP_0174269676 /NCGR_PEP_ID=MMETSP0439-20130205/41845_1 /TAXON_ID=0 /ORGANISM="Stereomyxa ramosa, Strain Chinc5" /LENGTH=239 /DNA_ID=CAMNT_0015358567 /DNA_START=330 /DNA_END=1049 /DNA_ORIENTATION=-